MMQEKKITCNKCQGKGYLLKNSAATKLGGKQPDVVKNKISKSIKEHWKTRRMPEIVCSI